MSHVVPVKSKVKILQNFVAFSEYMNFIFLTASTFYFLELKRRVPKKIKDVNSGPDFNFFN